MRRQGAPAGAIEKAAIPYFPPYWPVKCARLAGTILPQGSDVTPPGTPRACLGPLPSVIVAGGRGLWITTWWTAAGRDGHQLQNGA